MDSKTIAQRVKEIEEIIFSYIPAGDENTAHIREAMEYTMRAGGKRIRPMLMRESYRMFAGGREESVLLHKFMTSIEMIHSYSLCHDDLPAMDNDTLRRGKPSTWARFDEAFGVLSGDALLNYAYELIADELDRGIETAELRRGIRALNVLARKAGIYGMVGGQCLDVYSEKTEDMNLDMDQIMYIHKNKTAALLEASMMCGAILAGADSSCVDAVEQIAESTGLAFQIRDDILDVTSTTDKLGKPVGSDEKNNKVTYVTLKGLEEAQRDVEMYSEKAVSVLDELPGRNEFLRELILSMAGREM